MSDLIKRDDVEKAIQGLHVGDVRFFEMLRKNIDAIPSAVPERKKGKWLWDEEEDRCYCSECGNDDDVNYDGVYMMHDFCPNCGADMTGSEDEDAR